MKTLKVEAVYRWPTRPSRTSLPTFRASSIRSATPVDCAPLGYLSPQQFEDQHTRLTVKAAA
ncbi:hypothetical protein ACFPOB_04935 [Bosea eneae]|uniref:Transposase n=1 Tax=Bosea eneae TaxID=151454 RepID=A0ABW0IL40_9HYPH